MTKVLQRMFEKIDANELAYSKIDAYYKGDSPLAFLSPESKEALGSRFGKMGSNICKLAITSLAERLRVTGFTLDGAPAEQIWLDWLRNDMDQESAVAHREGLILGSLFVIVWGDSAGRPTISLESPRQVAVVRDPATRRIISAVKRWETADTTEATLFDGETITRYRAKHKGAQFTAMEVVETLDNPFGIPPVVELRNADRLLGEGTSELTDLMPLQDALNKLLTDMMVGSEGYARPRRWATGVELEENDEGEVVNPYPEGNKMMVAEEDAAKFGQLPAGDLASYRSAIQVVMEQMQAVSGLPAHYAGVTSNQPPSADALRAAEASLTARAEQKQQSFGRAWEEVAKLVHAVRTGLDPEQMNIRVTWADPSTRSIAQEADAVVKLFQADLLPASYALARLGYTDDEIKAIRTARRTEALDTAGTDLAALLP